ncbi:MAG TPA: metallophosphoesterase [Nitrososphaerales archaeon]|nr:metallophosphoesterase [Nitrososphaerales archaeon]
MLKVKVLFEKRALLLEEQEEKCGEQASLTSSADREGRRRFIVVGDLHIGFEEKFQSAGVKLNSNQATMLNEIVELVKETHATDLIINGDVKSGTDRILKSEWENVPRFFTRLLEHTRVHIILGNHDGGLSYLVPAGVELIDSNGFYISDTLILHGHTRPLAKFAMCKRLVMGHVHPIFQRRGNPLTGQPVWIFLKVERSAIFPEAIVENLSAPVDVILMPSFNLDLVVAGYSADAAKEERRVAPLVRELKSASEAIVTTLKGDVIGNASLLPSTL